MDLGIVTYNPNVGFLKEAISEIYNNASHIIIVDNNSSNDTQIKSFVNDFDKIVLISNTDNLGIAAALNQIVETSLSFESSWVILLDQDSFISRFVLEGLQYVTQGLYNDESNVGIVCPRIHSVNGLQFANLSVGSDTHILRGLSISNIPKCITSGSCVSTSVFRNVGGFDSKLFIDEVDYDYSYRLTRHGYQILRIDNLSMLHEVIPDENTRSKKLFNKIIQYNDVKPLRFYYRIRNLRYLSMKYKDYGHPFTTFLKTFVKILLFEDQKIRKISFLVQGYVDAKKI